MTTISAIADASDSAAKVRPWLAVRMLCWREIVRFFRQRNRVIGAVGQPLIFWLLFSAGFHRSFQVSDAGASDALSFQQFYFPGTLVLILMFTAIFATISIIEDRREGFLQSVLVAPIPQWSMVLGKVAGGALIALLQGLLFLALALTIDIDLTLLKLGVTTLWMFIAAVALTSLGVVIAWRMDSTQGFHAIMSVFLMPMWLLSGAFFPIPPVNAESSWMMTAMHWLMKCNPLTYCVAGLHHILFSDAVPKELHLPGMTTCWIVTLLFTATMFAAAWSIAGGRTRGDLL